MFIPHKLVQRWLIPITLQTRIPHWCRRSRPESKFR